MARLRGGGGRFRSRPQKNGLFSDALTPAFALYGVYMMKQIHRAMSAWGKDATVLMQTNAPWEDRTTDARTGLGWAVEEDWVKPKVILFHSVTYGKWLEIRWSGKYAIVMPTIESFGPKLITYIEDVI